MSATKTENASATEIDDTGVPLPRMSQIQALPNFCLSVTWAEGSRAGAADVVNLAPVINSYKFYRPLRKNEELFRTVHLVDDGNAIAWGDGTIDMSAELIEDIADQTMRPQDFAKFLERNKLTQEAAAALLGYSRRQIGYYLSTGPIPRVVALACYGYEARSGAVEERQLVPNAPRSVYAQATEEAHAMLSQAAQRFIDELKQMTSEMQRELETTRGELRKYVLKLPQETADIAAQMRGVVVDQIEALAELNRIVSRHYRGLDAVEPALRIESADAVVRRAEPVEAAPPRAGGRDEAATANGARPEPARQRSDFTGVAAPVIPARRAEAPPQPGGGRSGWLSELLTRAAQEADPLAGEVSPREVPPETPPRENPLREAPVRQAQPEGIRPERHTIVALDSLAVDIARLIDHDAAAELWDRYNRGERNVFSHKLYTMQGQKEFEEIRKKYRSERDFQRTVDRYIGEFERLLEEVSRDDRGQALARTYLTSETGRVYTMLAHAAGRFD